MIDLPFDRVTAPVAITIDLHDHTLRIPAGAVLEVCGVRPGDIRVTPGDGDGVWVPAKFFTRALR